ncbi:MlaD family protein [Falsiroseomonas oryziterrae]|uniref:MlaD family protein n=1 Tax=Falsiroseomonas oryziterrae TaxID=2911368 RepID=UPI001F1CC476|nr:MlaD family protein [Roseomonas sp. NPKOSM-4]
MKGKALYLRVGMLVVAGAILAAGFVIFLAGGRGQGPLTVFETYSRESVQGLDVGAPVRYRGVQIGRVTEIRLASTEYQRAAGVAFTEAFQLVLIRFAIDSAQIGEVPRTAEAVQLGLRARIAAQGITGVNYVELDFVPHPERFPPLAFPWTPRFPVIPSIPSTVAQVRGAAEQLVERLSQIPLEQIAQDLSTLVASLSRQSTDGDLAATLRETALTMARVRGVLESGEIERTIAEFRRTAEAAQGVASAPELRRALSSAASAADELRRSAERLPGTLQTFERTMRTARETTTDVQADLVPILQDLRATTASLRATADALRASPSQFLLGAPPPPPDRRR